MIINWHFATENAASEGGVQVRPGVDVLWNSDDVERESITMLKHGTIRNNKLFVPPRQAKFTQVSRCLSDCTEQESNWS